MAKCQFVKAGCHSQCGKGVAKGSDIYCKKHKNAVTKMRNEATRQAKIKADPEVEKVFKSRRLDNQRKRNQTNPEKFRKRLAFPYYRSLDKKVLPAKAKEKKSKKASEHGMMLRSGGEVAGDQSLPDQKRKIRRRLERGETDGQVAGGDTIRRIEEPNLTDSDESDDEDGEADSTAESEGEDGDEDKGYTLEEAAGLASPEQSTPKETDEVEEEDDKTGHEVTVEEASGPDQHPNPIGIRFLELYSSPASPSRLEDMTTLVQEANQSASGVTAEQVGVVYYQAVERHADETNSIWESPDRTASIFSALESEGILETVQVFTEERRASEEDVRRVHKPKALKQIDEYHQKFISLKDQKKKRLAFNKRLYKSKNIMVNEYTADAALLGAGALLTGVDKMVENGAVVFSDDRPPGCIRKVLPTNVMCNCWVLTPVSPTIKV